MCYLWCLKMHQRESKATKRCRVKSDRRTREQLSRRVQHFWRNANKYGRRATLCVKCVYVDANVLRQEIIMFTP